MKGEFNFINFILYLTNLLPKLFDNFKSFNLQYSLKKHMNLLNNSSIDFTKFYFN